MSPTLTIHCLILVSSTALITLLAGCSDNEEHEDVLILPTASTLNHASGQRLIASTHNSRKSTYANSVLLSTEYFVSDNKGNQLIHASYTDGGDGIANTGDETFGYAHICNYDTTRTNPFLRQFSATLSAVGLQSFQIANDLNSILGDKSCFIQTGRPIAGGLTAPGLNENAPTRKIIIDNLGADNLINTDDDLISGWFRYDYDSREDLKRMVYFSSPGSDSEWFTDDDIPDYYFLYPHRGGLLIEVHWANDMGDDAEWFSADDNLLRLSEMPRDYAGRVTSYEQGISFPKQLQYENNRVSLIQQSSWIPEIETSSEYSTFEYNTWGKLQKIDVFNEENNELLKTTNFLYNESGQLISSEYCYHYDEKKKLSDIVKTDDGCNNNGEPLNPDNHESTTTISYGTRGKIAVVNYSESATLDFPDSITITQEFGEDIDIPFTEEP